MPNIAENLLQISHLVQGARVGFSLLVMENDEDVTKRMASLNELVVKYTNDGPQLYIKKEDNGEGKLVPISAVDVGALDATLNSLLHIGVAEPKNKAKTTLWMRLMEDGAGDTKATNPEVISKFYDYMQKNERIIVPYVQQIFKDGKVINVTPFVHAGQVYIKLDNEDSITNMADVIKKILQGVEKSEKELLKRAELVKTEVGVIKSQISKWFEEFNTNIANINDAKGDLKRTVETLVNSLDISDLLPVLEKKIRPKHYRTGDATTGDYILTKIKVLSTNEVHPNGNSVLKDLAKIPSYYDHFNSPIYIERGWDAANNGWGRANDGTNMEMLAIGSWVSPLPREYYYRSQNKRSQAIDADNPSYNLNIEAMYPQLSGLVQNHSRVNFTYIRHGVSQGILDVFRFNIAPESEAADWSMYVWLKKNTDFTFWSRYIEMLEISPVYDLSPQGTLTTTVITENAAVPSSTILYTAGMPVVNMQFVDQLYITNEILLGNDLSIVVSE